MRRSRLLFSTVLSVMLCLSLFTSGKAEASMWTQTYDRDEFDRARSLVATSDGGYAIAGTTNSFQMPGDFWLIKTDDFGTVEWNMTYGRPEPYEETACSLVATSDGGYAIAGTTHPSDYFGDFWLIKTNAYGNEEWNQTYGGTEGEVLYSMVEAPDGGYAMVGTWDLPIFGGSGYTNNSWLIKTDADGNMEWNQTYTGGNAHSLVATSDGGYAIAGNTDSFNIPCDFWLIKTDDFGTVEWNMTYGGPNYEKASLLIETSDGGYAMAGTTKFYDLDMNSTADPWLVKTDADGNMEWNQTYEEAETEGFSSLIATSDGGYALAGTWYYGSFGAAGGMSDFWLMKTDANGNEEWNQTYGEADNEAATSLIETSDGGYALAGNLAYSSLEDVDIWLIKTDEFGVVPEAAWVILPLLLVATVSIFISKKKFLLKRS